MPPDWIQRKTSTLIGPWGSPSATVKKAIQESAAATIKKPLVTYSEALAPIERPKRPAINAPISGRKTIALYSNIAQSALHHIDVFHGDRTAVAIENNENCKTNGRFGRGNRQNEQGEDLADDVVQERRVGNHVDVDRQQDQFDRHQDDDDVLTVQEDTENAEYEEDGADRQVVGKTYDHVLVPLTFPRLRRPGPA